MGKKSGLHIDNELGPKHLTLEDLFFLLNGVPVHQNKTLDLLNDGYTSYSLPKENTNYKYSSQFLLILL